jgi:hypothetical protein
MSKHANKEQIKVTEAGATTETVAQCERVLHELTERRARVAARRSEIEAERARVSYDAHAKRDSEAERLLARAIKEALAHDEHLKSLDDALGEGRRRLERARAHEQREADRQKALAARDAAEKFWEHGTGIDGALELLREHINGKYAAQFVMRQNGVHHPSVEQVDAAIYRRIVGVMFDTPLRMRFEVLPPNERTRTVTAADESFRPMVTRAVLARLGEPITDEQTSTTEAA